MEALLAEMSGKMNSGSRKRKSSSSQAAQETTVQEQDASIAAFRSWIHEPLEPEKRMQRFLADESLGTRSSDKGIVRISNLFPQEVAEG